MRKMIPIFLALAAALTFSVAAQSQTLKTVQDRGSLICGVNPGLEGFASKDANGQWSGFDVDFCRASRRRSSTTRQRCNMCRCRPRTGSTR